MKTEVLCVDHDDLVRPIVVNVSCQPEDDLRDVDYVTFVTRIRHAIHARVQLDRRDLVIQDV